MPKPSLCPRGCGRPRRKPGAWCLPCDVVRKRNRRHQLAAARPKPVPLPPLEQAYQAREARDFKRELTQQKDALLDENKRLKKSIGEIVAMQRPPDVLVYKKASWARSDVIACAVASDWHVEEEVNGEAVHGLNAYNLDIAKERSAHFFTNLLALTDMMARESKITTLSISLLGDFFSGYIHEELKAATLLAPGDAARFVKGLFISGIDFLLKESKYVLEFDCIPGNHGRMTHQMWFSDPTGTSLETFMYHALAGRYEDNPRVKIRVAEHAMIYRKYFEKFVVRKIHGYEVKYGGGVGGLTIPLNKAISQWDVGVKADLTELGHFHQFFDGGTFLCNGSLIGYNTYAQAIKAKFEEARQAFYLIHARKGGCKSVVAPIWLDSAHRLAKPSELV